MNLLKLLWAGLFVCLALLSCKSKLQNRAEAEPQVNQVILDSGVIFKTRIPAEIERQYLKKFNTVATRHSNLVDKFEIDYNSFKNLINNNVAQFAKFYFIQNSLTSQLNVGLALSDNDNFKDISSDKKFILSQGKFADGGKLMEQIILYQKGLASQTNFNGKKATQCVVYKVEDIERYFSEMESQAAISQLNFNMIYFLPAKYSDGRGYTYISEDRYDRISFSVHALDTGGNFVDEGFDAGDLKP